MACRMAFLGRGSGGPRKRGIYRRLPTLIFFNLSFGSRARKQFFDFGQPGTIKELRETVRKVVQGANEEQLRLALKVFRAVVR